MADYKKMYHTLFHAQTDAIALLQKAQQDAEVIYIAEDETVITLVPPEGGSDGDDKGGGD